MLTENLLVELRSGAPGPAGDHPMFLGYRPADNILRYNQNALALDITTQSVRAQAEEFFPQHISANIVQVACIACHITGGAAQGLSLHSFVPAANPAHLQLNFSQFENLVRQRGRALILSKVKGEAGHLGGALLSRASQEYRDLDAFLQLLEQLQNSGQRLPRRSGPLRELAGSCPCGNRYRNGRP